MILYFDSVFIFNFYELLLYTIVIYIYIFYLTPRLGEPVSALHYPALIALCDWQLEITWLHPTNRMEDNREVDWKPGRAFGTA